MSDKSSETTAMSTVEFAQDALRNHLAPPNVGNVKARIRHAARRLRWKYSRTRDAWYADDRIRINIEELRRIEDVTGLRYGREELRTNEELIDRASALLNGTDPDFHRPFIAALRALFGVVDRA